MHQNRQCPLKSLVVTGRRRTKNSSPKWPTLVIVRRGTGSSTPNFHTETGHIREMLKVIREQSHTQGYRV
jgi:hypothetical protein